jgi:mannosyltransferase
MAKRRSASLGFWVISLALLCLAAALRFYRLDAQSYWHDEGNSLHLAGENAPVIIRSAAADIHPPGYYLLLSLWRAGLGETEFSLRGFSALAGVATVALLLCLGREFFDGPTALAAAALGAVNPFLVYYSQEARMYALLAALSAASFLLFSRWLRRSGQPPAWRAWRAGLGYVLVSGVGLFTHYAFGFVLLAQNAIVAGLVLGSRLPRLRSLLRWPAPRVAFWIALQAALLLLFLPWLPVAVQQLTTWPAARQFQPFVSALADMGRYLAFGRTIQTSEVLPALALAAAVALAGIGRGGLRRSGVAAGWVLIPAGLTLAFGLLSDAFSKFLLVAVPPLCLLLGYGLTPAFTVRGSKPRVALGAWGLSAGVIVAFATGLSLQNLYFNPAYFRDDYRGIARYVENAARPGDAIVLIAPNQIEAFSYYHRSGTETFPLPHARPLDKAETTAALEAIAATHQRLFVLFWADEQADPGHFVEGWLNTHGFKAADAWYGQVRLATYAVSAPAVEMSVPSGAQFAAPGAGHITLDGYSLEAAALSPGDILQITLFWQADVAPRARYKVFVHLYGALNQPPVAQQDGEPEGGLLPTTSWLAGQRYADNHGVLIPADLPPGRYTLAVGLYNLFDTMRLPVSLGGQPAGDRLELTTITVQ